MSMAVLQEAGALLKFRVMQLIALAAMIAGIGGAAMDAKYCVLDPDIWWHLKVGDWIVEHVAVPHSGLFSSTAAERPWTAYSWGYEVLLSRAYAWFGLVGFGVFGIVLTVMVAAVLFWVLLELSGRFWIAWLLTSAACYAFLFGLMPRPVFFSMAFFAIALGALLEAERTGSMRKLYWLPVLFAVWANLHIQFIYGLALFGLFVAVNGLQRLAAASKLSFFERNFTVPTLPTLQLAGVFAGCMLASCLGPYSYHLFQVVFAYSKAKVTYSTIIELLPLNFEVPGHYVQLLLAGGAFVAIGWQKKINPFKLIFLVIAAVVAFRTTRDAWFICIPAVAFIADAVHTEIRDFRFRLPDGLGVMAGLIFLLFLIARNTDFNDRGLDRAISRMYPVNAANYLRANPVAGSLYNSFDWGGFLIWYMPQYPVSVDGRNDLYGDELDKRLYDSEAGNPSYEQDPYLNAASVVLLKKSVPLAKLLTIDKRFRVYYQDELSAIFVRRPSEP